LTILAGIYLHIDLELSEEDKLHAKDYLTEMVSAFCETLYRQNVKLSIELHDGSIKVWLSIAGAIYIAIGQYGSFRSGLDQLIKDSHTVKNLVVNTLYKEGLSRELLLHEKRLISAPDKMRKILLKIDRLEKKIQSLSPEEIQKEKSRIIKSIEKLAHEVNSKDIDIFIAELPSKYHPNPENFPYSYSDYYIPTRGREQFLESPFKKSLK
tara:strand:- start:1847 stop:2476 length:630 start_codon:yes stop_codon:yes gene_type:complete